MRCHRSPPGDQVVAERSHALDRSDRGHFLEVAALILRDPQTNPVLAKMRRDDKAWPTMP